MFVKDFLYLLGRYLATAIKVPHSTSFFTFYVRYNYTLGNLRQMESAQT